MQRLIKKVLTYSYKPLLQLYLRKERSYRYGDISIRVFPGVFHPAFFFSTKILLSVLEKENLEDKTVLELGAGSGLIAIYAAKRGAIVTATDISERAIRNVMLNQQLNKVNIRPIHSDLLTEIPVFNFDFIIINPPYYKGTANTEAELAWYAGEEFGYFQRLFAQLASYMNEQTQTLMILSDECDISGIHSIGNSNQFNFRQVYAKKKVGETNFVYRIVKQ
jgi:release factor glutamine methyltransferase